MTDPESDRAFTEFVNKFWQRAHTPSDARAREQERWMLKVAWDAARVYEKGDGE